MAVVLIVDVGPTMREGGYIEDAQRAVRELVMQKLLHSNKDEVALLFFGSATTNNPLADKGYRNINVVRDFSTPSIALLRDVDLIAEEAPANADWIDALIVAMDLLISHFEARKKTARQPAKQIFLVTDGLSTAETNDLPVVVEQLQRMSAKLNVIGIGFDDPSNQTNLQDDSNLTSSSSSTSTSSSSSSSSISRSASLTRKRTQNAIRHTNQQILSELVEKVDGGLFPVREALEMLTAFYRRTVLQRSLFRGELQIGQSLSVPLWSFVKTMAQKLPTMKKVSAISSLEHGEPDPVQMDRFFASAEDPDALLAKDDLVKGYRYGNTILPFSAADEAALKYAAPKCLQLIGFTAERRVPCYYRLSNVEVLVSAPDDPFAAVACSALVQALHDSGMVAVVRYVKRANSTPHLGALFPYVKRDYDCFLYCKLPFAEDVRQYPFAPLGRDAKRAMYRPTDDQMEAAAALIERFDLMHAHFPVSLDSNNNNMNNNNNNNNNNQLQIIDDGEDDDNDGSMMMMTEGVEAFNPKLTYNPVLQHFWQCVRMRALDPACPIGKLDPVLMDYLKPIPELLAQASDEIARFKQLFPLQPAPEAEKSHRRFWPQAVAVDEVVLDSYIVAKKQKSAEGAAGDASAGAQELISFDAFTANRVSSVGTITPAADFRAMCARRDVDLVNAALDQIEDRILHLINDSMQAALYPKAFEALQAMREVCVAEDEPDIFNGFLSKLKGQCKDQQRHDFWRDFILKNGLSLINSNELSTSIVTPEEAAQFLHDPQSSLPSTIEASLPSTSTATSNLQDDSEPNADDLLAMI